MSQATLSAGYHNSNLFSNYYLNRVLFDPLKLLKVREIIGEYLEAF